MSQTVPLRSGQDRLRYAFAFEVSLMVFLIPAGAAFFDRGLIDIGLLGLILSVKAMLVHLLFNWVFDHLDASANRLSSDRSTVGRIVHAVVFEFSLVTTSLPIYIWWLNISLVEAFVTDLVVTFFVVIYTYLFTLTYDRMFPVQQDFQTETTDRKSLR